MLMEDEGREVVLCATAEEALQACAKRRFDLVVTDVSLPGISGTELARRLLRLDPSRWIVLCSGYDFADDVSRLGVNVRALGKPFELEELETLIAEIVAAQLR
ncbi:MAG: response regulator [Rhizobiales bacterium]|nr:response regulator [Rhizobacter sp.]